MDCFVSVEQFSEIEIILQPMFHIEEHSVQKSTSVGVYFSKVTTLHCTRVTRKEILLKVTFISCDYDCTDSNSTICRLYHIYFLEHIPEISCHKKNIFRKKSTVYQRLNKVAILPKMKLMLDLVEEALKVLMYLQENLLFSVKLQV